MYALRTVAGVSRVAAASFRVSSAISATARRAYSAHAEESYEEFNRRYTATFESVPDLFELQRNLDNCFAYDNVPSVETITAALHACRRVNDFPTAVRVFDALREKTNDQQYKEYMAILQPVKEQLGVPTKEELGF
ncbi:cytochrome c oxidase subunit VA-domain-containing protein [Syncephalis plumigaleata]|nr:cytochrome c oxidase subunit VA-domain-containing protein [Syncephalis plumigaleata]